MSEKQMTLGELIRWLDDNDVSYEIDNTGRLAVKDSLMENFRTWVKDHGYTSLPDELFHVNGSLWLEQTSIVSLGGLTSVGEGLGLWSTSITSLGNLISVGGWLDLKGTPITSLDNLTSVGEWLYLRDTSITSLGNLTSVGGNLMLQDTSITSLDDLPQVGEHLYLDESQCRLLTRGALQKVKGKIKHRDQGKGTWVTLSPTELEAIVAENERRESLHNTRGSDVDWDLYDR